MTPSVPPPYRIEHVEQIAAWLRREISPGRRDTRRPPWLQQVTGLHDSPDALRAYLLHVLALAEVDPRKATVWIRRFRIDGRPKASWSELNAASGLSERHLLRWLKEISQAIADYLNRHANPADVSFSSSEPLSGDKLEEAVANMLAVDAFDDRLSLVREEYLHSMTRADVAKRSDRRRRWADTPSLGAEVSARLALANTRPLALDMGQASSEADPVDAYDAAQTAYQARQSDARRIIKQSVILAERHHERDLALKAWQLYTTYTRENEEIENLVAASRVPRLQPNRFEHAVSQLDAAHVLQKHGLWRAAHNYGIRALRVALGPWRGDLLEWEPTAHGESSVVVNTIGRLHAILSLAPPKELCSPLDSTDLLRLMHGLIEKHDQRDWIVINLRREVEQLIAQLAFGSRVSPRRLWAKLDEAVATAATSKPMWQTGVARAEMAAAAVVGDPERFSSGFQRLMRIPGRHRYSNQTRHVETLVSIATSRSDPVWSPVRELFDDWQNPCPSAVIGIPPRSTDWRRAVLDAL